MSTRETPLKKAITLAEAFLAAQEENWGRDEWEKLLAEAEKAGGDLKDDEAKRILGNIVKSGKQILESDRQPGDGNAGKK